MSAWIILVVIAQIINAATVLIDKYILMSSKGIDKPLTYALYVSLLSGVVIILVPLGLVSWPSSATLLFSFFTALTFIFSIVLLYSSLKIAIPSDVIPVTAAVSAVTVFFLAFTLLKEDLPNNFLAAFIFLTLGTLLISHFRFNKKLLIMVFFAGLFFGMSTFLTKLLFLETSFINGFFWSRLANFFMAIFLIFLPTNLSVVTKGLEKASAKAKWVAVFNKTLAGMAFLLILLALHLGSVSVVSALAGLQFVFLLAFAYFSANRFPEIFHGEIHPHKFPHKFFGVILIIVGFAALFMAG